MKKRAFRDKYHKDVEVKEEKKETKKKTAKKGDE